jgi:alpha-tubulin suppressor-like RCC1 family protein
MPNQFMSPEGDLETTNYFVTEHWLIDQYVGDKLFGWGYNSSGPLGDNTTTTRYVPVTTFAGGTNWKSIAVGQGYGGSIAIKTDGTLWGWGSQSFGNLGTFNFPSASRITPVTTFLGGTDWKQASAENECTAAVKTDGTLWVWGTSTQLGINRTGTNVCTPVTTFSGGTNWKQVDIARRPYSLGTNASSMAAIKTDGTLWVWGDNFNAMLGVNDAATRCTPVTIFGGGTNWRQVSCGSGFTAAIKTDGTLWTWGVNTFGQLGINTTTDRSTPVTTFAGGTNWKQVSCGYLHTTAIKTDGTLWIWGAGGNGRLGDNVSISTRSTPITTFAGGNNWKQVSAGWSHTAAIKTDGTLWTWGYDVYGYGLLAQGSTTPSDRSTPVTTFAGGTNWKQVSCGRFHTIAVTSGEQIDIFDPAAPIVTPPAPPPPPPPPPGGRDDN